MLAFFASMIWMSARRSRPDGARRAGRSRGRAGARRGEADRALRACHPGRRHPRPASSPTPYTQARAGGARVHDAIDIMAPRGTPVVAAAAGTVEKLFFSHGGGGITAYVRSPDRAWIYYYAHLDAYAPGLARGPAGRAAATRSASSAAPATPAPTARTSISRSTAWARASAGGRARPINPYPLLAGRGPRR